ncbi:hypothetical protein NJ76_22830 [Rhodococcus sp. IITR03]|nr:hypothetical protein NJ76_22830 [Rhodococcus sp. IITR03]
MPTRALLYTDRFVDLSAAGFSPATAAEHTLAVQVPADPTLWRTGAPTPPKRPIMCSPWPNRRPPHE